MAEVLFHRGVVSDDTRRIIKHLCPRAVTDDLRDGDEFWSAERTASELEEGGYALHYATTLRHTITTTAAAATTT